MVTIKKPWLKNSKPWLTRTQIEVLLAIIPTHYYDKLSPLGKK